MERNLVTPTALSDDSDFLPATNSEELPIHSTPIKAIIPPFSTKKRAHSKKFSRREKPGHQRSRSSPSYLLQNENVKESLPKPCFDYGFEADTMTSQKTEDQLSQHWNDDTLKHNFAGKDQKVSHPQKNRTMPIDLNENINSNYGQNHGKFSFSSSKQRAEEMENLTIIRQRQEVHMLVSELRDRDRELNEMMTAHQQQLVAWEQDRQRLLLLEQKCHRYEDELQQKTKHIKNIHQELKMLQNNAVLQRTNELEAENERLKHTVQELQEKNKNITAMRNEQSSIIGQLQAHEQELTTMLKLKEKDVLEATDHIKELSARLKQLNARTKECQERELDAVKQSNQCKQRLTDLTSELKSISEIVELKDREVEDYRRRLDKAEVKRESLLDEYNQMEKCKDGVIESLKAKQARTDHQLKHMRELYERQQREMNLLQLNLDTTKEMCTKQQVSMDDQDYKYNSSTSSKSHSLSPTRTDINSSSYKNRTSSSQASGYARSKTETRERSLPQAPSQREQRSAREEKYLSPSETSDFESPRYSSDSNYFSQSQNSTRPQQMGSSKFPHHDARNFTASQNNYALSYSRQGHTHTRQEKVTATEMDRFMSSDDFSDYKKDTFSPVRSGYSKRPSSPENLSEQIRSLSPIPLKLDLDHDPSFQGRTTHYRQASSNFHSMDKHTIPFTDINAKSSKPPRNPTNNETKKNFNKPETSSQESPTGDLGESPKSKEDSAFCTPPLQRVDNNTTNSGDSGTKGKTKGGNYVSEAGGSRHGSEADTEQFVELQQESLETNEQGSGPQSGSKKEAGHEHRISFEERLSTFLDDEQDIDVDELLRKDRERSGIAAASPGRKLHKLLLESRKMIENLEKSSNSVNLFKEDEEARKTK